MFGYSATILSAMLWPSLPLAHLVPILIGISIAIVLFKRAPLLAGVVLAVAWISIYAQLVLRWEPDNIEPREPIIGEIIALVNQNSDWVSMDFRLLGPHSTAVSSKKIRLSWSKAPELEVGEIWQLRVKLKPITSVLNQGGYNQQKMLLSRHIVSKGKVISGQRLEASGSLRNTILQILKPSLQTLNNGDLILALLLGDRSLIDSERWHSLRVTGSGHLIAISGLHLSVVAAWVFVTVATLLGYLSLSLGRRNLVLAALTSAVACAFYAYLAGFSLPTQRALIMLLLLVFLTMSDRYSSSWERLLYALFILLVIDPFSCLSAGFWLSFFALSIILLTLQSQSLVVVQEGQQTRRDKLIQRFAVFWAIQWRLSLGLGLLQALFFGGLTVYGILFNFLFVPWFSLVVIPVAILVFTVWGLCWIVDVDASSLFYVVNLTLWPADQALEAFVTLPGAWLPISETMMLAISFLLLGLLFIAKVKRTDWKLIASLLCLPFMISLFLNWFSVSEDAWQVHLLDVGQGLSVVVEKDRHALVYDTGARYGTFSYAERVVVPFIRARGITDVDYLVLSHSDNDHAGGANELISVFPSVTVVSDIKQYSILNCRPKNFSWQNLTIEIVGPMHPEKGNNGSCVVRVSDDHHQVLLTGDIEKSAEQALQSIGEGLRSEVLVVPHHGSRTSSTANFIEQVSPELVLFPSGFNNRYGFPKSDILQRYVNQPSEYRISGREGQVSILFDRDLRVIRTYRADLAPFWYNRLFEFGENDNPE